MSGTTGRQSDRLVLSGREALLVAALIVLAALVLAVRDFRRRPQAGVTFSPSPLLVNVNAAPPALLEAIPGIGRKSAERIVRYRSTVGPISSPAELSLASGLPGERVSEILPFITFGPPREKK